MTFLFNKKDVRELIRADHAKVIALYKQYQMPYTSAEQKQMLAYSIIREVVMHSAAEETVVYPVMRRYMGDQVQDHVLHEHQILKDDLAWLSWHTVRDPNYDARLQHMMTELVRHAREEEQDLLPRLAATEGVTHDTLYNLGRFFELAKRIAPTRPRALAPNKPAIANLAVNGAFAPMDWALDMIRFQGAPPL